jgi:hypothetical protein
VHAAVQIESSRIPNEQPGRTSVLKIAQRGMREIQEVVDDHAVLGRLQSLHSAYGVLRLDPKKAIRHGYWPPCCLPARKNASELLPASAR